MCAVPDCVRDTYARDHCERHYRQLLRTGQVRAHTAPTACGVTACDRAAVTRGWCHGHYLRWSRNGDVRADVPLRRSPGEDRCGVPDCERGRHSAQYCRSHQARLRRHGDPLAGGPLRQPRPEGSLSHGYRKVRVPVEERWLVGGQAVALEHRLALARLLGRPLRSDESVHHRNGDRLDNRPANLELWSRFQPSGARVADHVAWAEEVLRRYAPELLSGDRTSANDERPDP